MRVVRAAVVRKARSRVGAALTMGVCCDALWTMGRVEGRVVTSLGSADEGSRSIAEPLPPGCGRRGSW